jgi:hypothetical protein
LVSNLTLGLINGPHKKKKKKSPNRILLETIILNLPRPKFCFPKRTGDKFGIPQGGFNLSILYPLKKTLLEKEKKSSTLKQKPD